MDNKNLRLKAIKYKNCNYRLIKEQLEKKPYA